MRINKYSPKSFILYLRFLLGILLVLVVFGISAWAQTGPSDVSAKEGCRLKTGAEGEELPSAAGKHVTLTDYAEHKKGKDWAPAFKQAFGDCPSVYVPAGRYPCSQVRLSSGTTIYGAGAETVFLPLSSRLFVIEGKAGPEIKIASDIKDFSNAISLQSDGDLAVGDDIMIRGQRNSMIREGTAGLHYSVDWVLGRTRKSNCFFGEMDVVKSVAGTKITTKNRRIFPDYFQDDSREPADLGKGFIQREATTVSKLSLVKNVTLRGFSIEGTAECYMPFKLRYCKDCVLEDIVFKTSTESYDGDKPSLSLIYGIYVWNTKVKHFRAELSPELLSILDAKEKTYKNFSNYNLFKIISSTNSGFENCEANGGTHAFSITRSASASSGGGIPSVNCFVRNCAASNCIWAGVKVQQGCYNTEVLGNMITASGQGIITCGRKTTIVDNKVDTDVPYSVDEYYTHHERGGTYGIGLIEGYACDSVVKNNTISNFYSGIAFVDGYEEKNCFEEGNVLIEGNTVANCLRGFMLYKNPHCESLGKNDLNITIANNTFARTGDHTVMMEGGHHDTYGVYLPAMTAGVEIRSNAFRNFGHGIWLDESVDYVDIRDNQFENSGCGITLATASSDSKSDAVHLNENGNTFTGTALRSQGLTPKRVTAF